MTQPSTQIDPLNSPYPVPWGWVQAIQAAHPASDPSEVRYYRTQSLLSPDRQYAAYSRIRMQVAADFTQSSISSLLFVENLQTRDLQPVAIELPKPGLSLAAEQAAADLPQAAIASHSAGLPGTIAIVMPISWSATGDRLLAREFEGLFGSDIGSDHAVICDRQHHRSATVAPVGVDYTHAILLGWSQRYPERALFSVRNLGDPQARLYAVDTQSLTSPAAEDQPLTYGQVLNTLWAGPQSSI